MISIITPAQLDLDPILSVTLSSVAMVLLVIMLTLKELVANLEGPWQTLARYLNVGVIPLLVTLFVTMATRLVDILQ